MGTFNFTIFISVNLTIAILGMLLCRRVRFFIWFLLLLFLLRGCLKLFQTRPIIMNTVATVISSLVVYIKVILVKNLVVRTRLCSYDCGPTVEVLLSLVVAHRWFSCQCQPFAHSSCSCCTYFYSLHSTCLIFTFFQFYSV